MTDLYKSSASLPVPEIHGYGLWLRPWDADAENDVRAWLSGYRVSFAVHRALQPGGEANLVAVARSVAVPLRRSRTMRDG